MHSLKKIKKFMSLSTPNIQKKLRIKIKFYIGPQKKTWTIFKKTRSIKKL